MAIFNKLNVRSFANGGSLGAGINDTIPPIVLNYKPIKRAEKPAFELVPYQLKAESKQKATELAKQLQDDFEKSVKDKKFLRFDKERLQAQTNQLQQGIYNKLLENPYYFADPSNRQAVVGEINNLVNDSDHEIFAQRKEQTDEYEKNVNSDKTADNVFLDQNGDTVHDQRTGKSITKSEAANLYRNESLTNPYFAHVIGANKDNPNGKLFFDHRKGTINDVNTEIKDIANLIKPDKSGWESSALGNNETVLDEYNKFTSEYSSGNTESNNHAKIEAAKQTIANKWKERLSDESKNAIVSEGYKNWGKIVSPGQTMNNDQLLTIAKAKNENSIVSDLKENRNSFTDTYGYNYIADRLNLNKVREHTGFNKSSPLRLKGKSDSDTKPDAGNTVTDPTILEDNHWINLGETGGLFGFGTTDRKALKLGESTLAAKLDKKPEKDMAITQTFYTSDGVPQNKKLVLKEGKIIDTPAMAVYTGKVQHLDIKNGTYVDVSDNGFKPNHMVVTGGDLPKELADTQPSSDGYGNYFYSFKENGINKRVFVKRQVLKTIQDKDGGLYFVEPNNQELKLMGGKNIENPLSPNRRQVIIETSRGPVIDQQDYNTLLKIYNQANENLTKSGGNNSELQRVVEFSKNALLSQPSDINKGNPSFLLKNRNTIQNMVNQFNESLQGKVTRDTYGSEKSTFGNVNRDINP